MKDSNQRGQRGSCHLDHCGPEPLTMPQAMAIRAGLATYVGRRASGLTVEDSLGTGGFTIDPESWDRKRNRGS
jgi:hypothetical protein